MGITPFQFILCLTFSPHAGHFCPEVSLSSWNLHMVISVHCSGEDVGHDLCCG